MVDLISRIITYAFVVLIYLFIFRIIQLVYLDIKVMSRKKAGLSEADAYLKLITLRHDLDFSVAESYSLSDNNIIGRGKKCSIQIEDPFLSQSNTKIYKRDKTFFIEDMESTNGTFLNGEEVDDDAVELFDGDRITIGQLSFIFVMPAPPDEIIK